MIHGDLVSAFRSTFSQELLLVGAFQIWGKFPSEMPRIITVQRVRVISAGLKYVKFSIV
jgi:hypothetical protein